MPKCAVVNNDGLVVNIIIADPSVDSLPESTLIECDDNVYIDCTWDDPVGGGYENYKYYLSESLWSDHIAETAKDLSEDGKYDWEHYYLTGADYAR